MKKKCTKCGETKSAQKFYKQSDKKDGLQSHCKSCIKESRQTDRVKKSRDRYNQSAKAKATIKRYNQSDRMKARVREYDKVHPERRGAMNAVNNAIRYGKLPRATTQVCTDCKANAQHYHHESYAKKNWLNVIPLCVKCHKQRHRSS